MIKKAIVLAGGNGSRLYPSTISTSKQLLPIYDKPLIYYPLSIIMLAGIREVLLISSPEQIGSFKSCLSDGSNWGISISYAVQESPRGIADAILVAEDFIGDDPFCLILGDNVFYGDLNFMYTAIDKFESCTIFAYNVNDPERFGVVKFDRQGKAKMIVEKPKTKISNWAVPGLYLFDSTAIERTRNLSPSARGELEITDLNRSYMEDGLLNVQKMNRGLAWFDTGTPESLLEASNFLHTIEKTQNQKVACLEEIALKRGFIDLEKFNQVVNSMPNCDYKDYCKTINTQEEQE
jgi:glucose-1-phosphate thymidylyltransferase